MLESREISGKHNGGKEYAGCSVDSSATVPCVRYIIPVGVLAAIGYKIPVRRTAYVACSTDLRVSVYCALW